MIITFEHELQCDWLIQSTVTCSIIKGHFILNDSLFLLYTIQQHLVWQLSDCYDI